MEQIPKTPNGQDMYTILIDGNNQKHKIVNFDNPEMVPHKGIKIVRAIRKSSRHQPSSSIRVVRDPITNIIFGIPAGLHETSKEPRFLLLEVNDMRHYDLSILQDRKEWAVISRAPFLIGSPFAKGKPSHQLEDVEAEAAKKVKMASEREAAYDTIKKLSEVQLIDMARNVGGIDTRNNSIVVIKGELIDFVDSKEPSKGPKKFNEIWAMSNRDAFTVFGRCKHVGLVDFDLTNGWLWKKSTQLGTSEPMAIEYITKNPSLLMAMDQESKSMDDKFSALATPEEKAKAITTFNVPKEVDSNILKEHNEVMARMSEKERMLDALLAKANGLSSVNVYAKPEVDVRNAEVVIENTMDTTELRALQDRAKKEYGMAHAYITKDPVKLQEWINTHPKIEG